MPDKEKKYIALAVFRFSFFVDGISIPFEVESYFSTLEVDDSADSKRAAIRSLRIACFLHDVAPIHIHYSKKKSLVKKLSKLTKYVPGQNSVAKIFSDPIRNSDIIKMIDETGGRIVVTHLLTDSIKDAEDKIDDFYRRYLESEIRFDEKKQNKFKKGRENFLEKIRKEHKHDHDGEKRQINEQS